MKEVRRGLFINVVPEQPTVTVPKYNLSNLVITRNTGLEVPKNGNKYYLDPGDTVEVTGEIVDAEGVVQSDRNASIIKLPVTKHADDMATTDEIYFTGNLVNGVLSVSGDINLSGNYKALASRNNRALDRMPAGFHMNFDDVDFLV
jgi:hypothetical protein